MKSSVALTCMLAVLCSSALKAKPVPKELLGDWSLNLESGEPAWMSVGEEEVRMRVYVGPEGPYSIDEVNDGRLKFSLKPMRKAKGSKIFVAQSVEVGITDGKMDGNLTRTPNDGSPGSEIRFTGKRIPPMPESPPDLSKVRFGHPISLFNGKDLTGWRAYEKDKKFGWSVKDGLLVNDTPKTDFSATGAYANLRTEAEFEDFWLHAEFLVEAQRNSGIYLRGMYEVQVVDRDSRMQGIQGIGSLFSRIEPTVNAGNPPGEWNTYDITLVDRHVTVVLNGIKVIDNQPVIGPTGGAIYTNPASPGPIYLQGDHTSVKFKNFYLAPVVDVE
ncbi:MAG: DUF1080 domain-containing protein [Verrucomicrobiota bacterium]